MKNLVVVHLESVSTHRLAAFAAAFPNLRRLRRESLVFANHFSSATSTLMFAGYLLHGNDFEFDTETVFEGMRPARNNRNLFSLLRERGYAANLLCLDGFWNTRPTELSVWRDDLPPISGTNDYPSLFARFDELTQTAPFAIYWWDQLTHIEHSLALAPAASGLTDQIRRACATADDALGVVLGMLARKGLLDSTTIVVCGDHGDDLWTHGFKGGMIHATEPYTDITWTPLSIRDPGLAPGTSDRLASTVDIRATCLSLLGVDDATPFPGSGSSLLEGARPRAYSQNFMANQPDNAALGIAKAFAVTDETYTLLASSRGLEMYAWRLDPGNQCNLLHFFDLRPDGRLEFRQRPGAAGHFRAALQENPAAIAHLARSFDDLRDALRRHVQAKRDYIVERGVVPAHALAEAAFETMSKTSRDAFFRSAGSARHATASVPAFDFSYKLR